MRDELIKIETEESRLRPLYADLQVPDTASLKAHRLENENIFLKKLCRICLINGEKGLS